ncbi:MAG: hypothetical protein HC860_01390 [Alkalinema sp. RU_4_3]|nr:hypothetical protein [Alkalinema sp. RU_4_3]
MSDPLDLDDLELEALENRNRNGQGPTGGHRRKLESDMALPSRQANRFAWPKVRLKPLSGWLRRC